VRPGDAIVGPPAGSTAPGDTLLDRLQASVEDVLRRWPIMAATAFVAAVAVGALIYRQPKTYSSVASIILQGGRSGSSLSGLASQFGISLPTTDVGQSPALYLEVLRSRSVLTSVALEPYCNPCGAGRPMTPLVRIFDIREPDSVHTMDRALRMLGEMVSTDISPKTGIISLTVTARSPVLAQQIGQHVLDATRRFNLETRQTQAGAERRFSEGRLVDVGNELRAAEQRLKAFRESNRFTGMSPELQLRENALDREVRRYEEVYTALARSVEQSKIDEVRDTPTIITLDPPSLPIRSNSRGTILKAAFGGLLGAFLAGAVLLLRELRRRTRLARRATE